MPCPRSIRECGCEKSMCEKSKTASGSLCLMDIPIASELTSTNPHDCGVTLRVGSATQTKQSLVSKHVRTWRNPMYARRSYRGDIMLSAAGRWVLMKPNSVN
jgi:hypothetical protein